MTELTKSTLGADEKRLSVALVSPDEAWRIAAAALLNTRPNVHCHDVTQGNPDPRQFAATLAGKFDAVLIDVDTNPEYMHRFGEALAAEGSAYVMAASAQSDMKLAVRFMRAGVREFFTLPVDPAEVVAALNRAANRPVAHSSKPLGKLYVFLGAKGGVGVTTLAANFALALAQETEKKTLIIDFGLPLGDVAINLGMHTQSQFSVINALVDTHRLDNNFLSTITMKHDSGLSVLAAPTEFPDVQPPVEAFDKLLTVARQNFEFVIVDAGSRIDLFGTTLFQQCTTVYLITQVGVVELRNAHRMITQFLSTRDLGLQVVLNRYTQRALLFDDAQITKTLTRAADWKMPDDYAAARRNRESATPLAMIDSPFPQPFEKWSAASPKSPRPKKASFACCGNLQSKSKISKKENRLAQCAKRLCLSCSLPSFRQLVANK